MLRCKEIVARSSDYLEGDLSRWQVVNYKLHLMMCVHCRRYLKHFKIAIESAARVARKKLPDEQAQHISQQARGPKPGAGDAQS